ncbi:sulfatase [Paenibacillus sp. Soil766]|uniref:sulfatase family protein n=1 Tax=Paenibacillus sp. Soil766 TaxID=1736404 RepID=UPI00070AFB83|nr:sulfatase-like hydrolase/transferase [Paenibacillus sp. Soil766]KRF03699.1 sulfatase [Paenibacillus sp. Soil766]
MKKPNILWICTDQQRYDTLGCYGNTYVQTPNIDRLAEKGTLFEQSYCQSPVCSPSRASFLTGRYPRTTKIRQNGQSISTEEVLVTRLLAENGYTCGLAGKLHISACHPSIAPSMEARINDGYSEFRWSHHPMPDWQTNEYTQWLQSRGKIYGVSPIEDCKYVQIGPDAEDQQTTWCAEMAINFIETSASFDRPWLYSVNMYDPHHAFTPDEKRLARYVKQLESLPSPSYKEGELDSKPEFQKRDSLAAYGKKNFYPFAEMTERDHLYLRAAYWAMVDLIDEQVGRMIEALERSGQLDNTMIIFMSDHGELLGDHGIYLKGPHFYDPSVRVPLLISWPGKVLEARRLKAMVELVDLAPTLLDAAGLPIYAGMQGRSLWPLLTGSVTQDKHRDDVYCEFYNSQRRKDPAYATMIRTQAFKLVACHGHKLGELYDLSKDPGETVNLWNDAAYTSVKLELYQRLCDRMAETADPLPVRTTNF